MKLEINDQDAQSLFFDRYLYEEQYKKTKGIFIWLVVTVILSVVMILPLENIIGSFWQCLICLALLFSPFTALVFHLRNAFKYSSEMLKQLKAEQCKTLS